MIEAGDFKDIDEYVKEVKEKGYEVNYENIYSDSMGFIAKVTVNGKEHAVFKGEGGMPHMVRNVITPLSKIGMKIFRLTIWHSEKPNEPVLKEFYKSEKLAKQRLEEIENDIGEELKDNEWTVGEIHVGNKNRKFKRGD